MGQAWLVKLYLLGKKAVNLTAIARDGGNSFCSLINEGNLFINNFDICNAIFLLRNLISITRSSVYPLADRHPR